MEMVILYFFLFFLRDLWDQIDQLMYEIKGKSAVYQVYVIGKSVFHITINSITKEKEGIKKERKKKKQWKILFIKTYMKHWSP